MTDAEQDKALELIQDAMSDDCAQHFRERAFAFACLSMRGSFYFFFEKMPTSESVRSRVLRVLVFSGEFSSPAPVPVFQTVSELQ